MNPHHKARRRGKAAWRPIHLLLPLGLSAVFIAATQLLTAPTYASQLTQLVTVTGTPEALAESHLLFITSDLAGDGAHGTLARLETSLLADLPTLNAPLPENAIIPLGAATDHIPTGCDPHGLNAAPRGPWVALELECNGGHASVVRLSNAVTGEARPLGSDLGSHIAFLGWSPNGQHVVLLTDVVGDARAVLVAVADSSVIPLNTPADVYNVAISNSGTRMIYSLTRGLGYGSETWIADIDGSNAQRVIADPTHIIAYARFSPDDTHIAYLRMPDSNIPFTVGELWVMNADGREPRRLDSADAGHGYEPAWSPDGTQIAYVVRENSDDILADQRADRLASNIHVVNVADGTIQARTSFENALVEAPVWSGDGEHLAFAAWSPDGPGNVWLYAPNTPERQVAPVTQSANVRYPVFTSDR